MKKVLHLTLYLDIGGLERMVCNLCIGQRAVGWNPSVFVYERETGELLPDFQKAEIPVTFYRKGPGFSFRLLFRIYSHLQREAIPTIHSHDLGALIYASLVKLLSRNSIQLIHTQHSFQHLKSKKARLYERIFPFLADRIVCVSEDLRRTYLKLGQPFQRLRVIPNGVDFAQQPRSKQQKADLRGELLRHHSLPPELAEKKWVVTLGRLARVKGPQHAIGLWKAVKPEFKEGAVLLLVGPEVEPGFLSVLRKEAAAESGIFFPGSTLDPQSWLQAADLYLSASEFEGLPLAGLEAASTRLPMLLSQIPGHTLFKGWAAYYSLSDLSTGARTVEFFLASGSLGETASSNFAIERLARSCGVSRMAERYLQVYEEHS